MITVCICDDDASSRKLVRSLCQRMLDEVGVGAEARFFEFADAESMLVGLPSDPDLIFLDVVMGRMSGIEAAREIRRENTAVSLVFMSNYATYAVEGYAVQAYRYLLKPIVPQRFHDELADVFRDLATRRRSSFTVKNEDGVFAIDPARLSYVETDGSKKVAFHVGGERIVCRSSLKTWDDALSGMGFFRCHSAYLVNLAYVDQVLTDGSLRLSDGERIPVSRHRHAKLIEALSDFAARRL